MAEYREGSEESQFNIDVNVNYAIPKPLPVHGAAVGFMFDRPTATAPVQCCTYLRWLRQRMLYFVVDAERCELFKGRGGAG